MAKIQASQTPSPQDLFLGLLKQGILKLDLAELDFGGVDTMLRTAAATAL